MVVAGAVSPRTFTALARIALAVTAAAIFHLATTDRVYPAIEGMGDKFDHAVAFAVLALLVDASFPARRFGLAKIGALLAFGLAIETVQYFLPYREASLYDWLADAAGIALYVPFIPLLAKLPVLRRPAKD